MPIPADSPRTTNPLKGPKTRTAPRQLRPQVEESHLKEDLAGGGMVLFEFTSNHASAVNTTFAILAGDNPPAQRAGLGNLDTVCAQNVTKLVGPLETARFIQDDGKINVTVTPASGTIAASIRCYKFPKTA